ncbi:MAG: hypothetical protein IJN21_03125 [Clostridia bacterium]|nr:hypothetical protein [Clostridia bacterium]
MNPFLKTPSAKCDMLLNWKTIFKKPYDKRTTDAYTKTRVILMNGTEFENVWFSHQAHRNMLDNNVRRQLALIRRSEQQQQKLLCSLKPADETMLEHTISYEQLAVDLTAHLAKRTSNANLKMALDFALLEDFDHLYRYANLLKMESGVKAENLVGHYTEIMPARPTIAHHRHPYDSVRFPDTRENPPIFDVLASNVITAAEQQTMNYYMNVSAVYPSEYGKKLYQEIGMIEEQHVTHYGSLLNPTLTWLENLLVHQYTECWLYWSMAETEIHPEIKDVWKAMFEIEIMHLKVAEQLLKDVEGKSWQDVIPEAEFPAPLKLESNIPYVRGVLENTVDLTAKRENYADVNTLDENSDFFEYQRRVNGKPENVMSHIVIHDYISRNCRDYRYETAPNPIEELRNYTCDNVCVGRRITEDCR